MHRLLVVQLVTAIHASVQQLRDGQQQTREKGKMDVILIHVPEMIAIQTRPVYQVDKLLHVNVREPPDGTLITMVSVQRYGVIGLLVILVIFMVSRQKYMTVSHS